MKHVVTQSRYMARKTQQDMADLLYISLRHYQRIEAGVQPVCPDMVVRIAEVSGNLALADTYCGQCPVRRLRVVKNEREE